MSYSDLLTEDFVEEIIANDWNLSQVIEVLTQRQTFEKDFAFERCCKTIPNYQYIAQWYKDFVHPRIVIETLGENGNQKSVSGAIWYQGNRFTATVLSKITGLSVRTIYKYWQDCDKNQILFEEKIAARVDHKILAYYLNKQAELQPELRPKPELEIELS